MIYNITYEFEGHGVGWSETHAARSSEQNPRLLQEPIRIVAQKRANFLGSPFTIKAVRIARFYDDLTSLRVRGSFLVKERFTAQNPNTVGDAEPANVALIVRGFTAQTAPELVVFNGNQNTTFCGGPPDLAVTSGGDVKPAVAGLGAAFDTWGTALVTTTAAGVTVQHGWLAVKREVDTKIVSAVQNDNGTVRITTELSVIPPFTINQPGKVRVRRVNQGRSPINRELIVFPNSGTILDTYEVIGIPTPQVGGRLRAYSILPVFLNYGGLVMELETGKHKRGRPPGSIPGRLPVVIRG